jgi:hypothetical protein
VVDAKTLAKQFGSDPGLALLDAIRAAPEPVRATVIKRDLLDAGVRRADIDRQWKRLQPSIKAHPHVQMENNRYAWSADPQPARQSLDVLAAALPARIPGWLAQALVANVADGLDETAGEDSSWVGKEFEKARLVADLAVAVDVLRTGGAGLDAVAELFAEELRRKRLWPIGRPGETVLFDPASHHADGDTLTAGTQVAVVRSGYAWHGGGEPRVAAKAAVTA